MEVQYKLAVEYADTACPTNDQWQFRRGELNTLRVITHYEEYIRSALDNLDLVNEMENDDVDCL